MIPQEVVDEVTDRLRDCLRELEIGPADYGGDEIVEALARRATEVVTTIAGFDWPQDKPAELAGVDPDSAGQPPSDGRSP